MHLYTEARALALEAFTEAKGDLEQAQEFLHQSCDGHEVAIYYHKAITFCAEQDTDAGEQWLEDCGGIAQPGDSFGQIACRIAFATLLCAAQDALHEIAEAALTEAALDHA
jgi:CRP-like cAMP-binding protein